MMLKFLSATAVAIALATPATAQTAPAAASPAAEPAIQISAKARKAIVELQTAVNAKDVAAIPAKAAAAQAAAQTPQDRYVIAQLQLKAATAANDKAGIAAAVEALLATGQVGADKQPMLHTALGGIHYDAKRYDQAAAAFEQALALRPGHDEATAMLVETRHAQGRSEEAVALLRRAMQAKTAAGQKAEEKWYKRGIAIAYGKRLPVAADIARDWVVAYPGPASWKDALAVYRNLVKPTDAVLLDTLRLARATKTLSGNGDYVVYAGTAIDLRNGREAQLLIEEAIAAKALDPANSEIKGLLAELQRTPRPGPEILAAAADKALAGGPVADLLLVADRHYGVADYAKAAELFRAALGRPGVDKDLANLRLGMALARSGDKAGAKAALALVAGNRASLARLWSTYVDTQA